MTVKITTEVKCDFCGSDIIVRGISDNLYVVIKHGRPMSTSFDTCEECNSKFQLFVTKMKQSAGALNVEDIKVSCLQEE